MQIATDLFGAPLIDQPMPAVLMEFPGTLTAPPQIRTRSNHGAAMPVLCLEIQGDGPSAMRLHAEIPFDEAHRKQAEQQAHTLRPGQRVAITSNVSDVRLTLHHAISVAVVESAPETTTR